MRNWTVADLHAIRISMKTLMPSEAAELPILSGLDDVQVDRLLEKASVEEYPSDAVLFSSGEMAAFLYVIMRGMVELYAGKPPRECALFLMSSGDVFMPAATLFAEPYLNSARTLTPSRLLLIPAEAVRYEFVRSHQMAINCSRMLAGHFRLAAKQIIDLRSCSAAQRLGRFLLRLVEEAGTGATASLPASKGRLAARVGMTRETFSRALQTLADNGLVVRGPDVEVRDRARIESFCGHAHGLPSGELGLDVRAI